MSNKGTRQGWILVKLLLAVIAFAFGAEAHAVPAVSYTHLTLPTIYSV